MEGEVFYRFETRQFTITATALPDPDADLSYCDAEQRRRIDQGTDMVFGVVVRCTLHDGTVLATESLWGCVYESPAEFIDHRGSTLGAVKDSLRFSIEWLRRHAAGMSRKRFADALNTINRSYQYAVSLSKPGTLPATQFSALVTSVVRQARATVFKQARTYRSLALELRCA